MPAQALALHRGFRPAALMHRPRPSAGTSVLDRLKSKMVRATRQHDRPVAVEGAASGSESMLVDDWKGQLVGVGLAVGTGVTLGAIQGYGGKNALKIGPVPWDLPVGAALVTASLWRGAGRATMPMRAIGTALLVGHGMTWGRGGGKWWRQKRGLPPLIEVSGEPTVPQTGGGALSDEELASVAQRK